MTWFGNSFSSLKDQITTLTKEVLAEADEEREQPRFIPFEKFDRLVKICEEKEEQLCDLQQEVDLLRNRLGLSVEGDSTPSTEGKTCHNRNDGAENVNNEAVATGTSRHEIETSVANEEEEETNRTEQDYRPSVVECNKENSSKSSLQDVFREIENLDVENLAEVYKRVRRIYEEEKRARSSDTKTFQPESRRHGSDETMSNNSEKSDDSLLNDFEVLKSRGSSSKSSTDEFTPISNAPDAETQPCTQMTRSTSTQSDYEFSLIDSTTQTDERSTPSKSHTIEKNDTRQTVTDFTEEQFLSELNNILPEGNEPVRNSIIQLLKRSNQISSEHSQIDELVERESSLEERLKVKNTSIAKHVSELNTYSKKLENFCSSLSEVSDELVDQDVELSSLYKELKTLYETKDLLEKENAELSALVEKSRETAEESTPKNVISETETELREAIAALNERNQTIETEYKDIKKTLELTTQRLEESQNAIEMLNSERESSRTIETEYENVKETLKLTTQRLEESQSAVEMLNRERESYQTTGAEYEDIRETLRMTTQRLEESQNAINMLSGELEGTRQALLGREESFVHQINSLCEKIGGLELEAKAYSQNALLERQKRENLISDLKRQLSDRESALTTSRAQLQALHEERCKVNAENEQLKSLLTEAQSQVQASSDNNDSTTASADDAVEDAKSALKKQLKERLEETVPYNIADIDIDDVFQSIARFSREVVEFVDPNEDDTHPLKVMILNLPNWYERLVVLKKSEETAAELTANIQTLEARVAELESRLMEAGERNKIIGELEDKLNTLGSERDQVIASLKEKHSENLLYHSELQKIHALYTAEVEKNKQYSALLEEAKQKLTESSNVASELERLREHLLTVEQSYTGELVSAEKRIQELQCKLTEYEERIQSMNAVQTSVSVRANQMSESLQKEVKTLTQDKEQLSVALKKCRAELQQHVHEVLNLRSALDLFHLNKDSEVFEATEKLRSRIEKLEEEKRALCETVRSLQTNLEMTKRLSHEKLQLSEDLKSKTQTIEELETQLTQLRSLLKKAEDEIIDLNANANSENQFKSDLLKNIFVRYVTSNTDSMKVQTLQILSEVLNFSPQEKRSLGLPVTSGTLDDGKGLNVSNPQNNSLIDEFIRFMEKESDPKERRKIAEKQIAPGSSNILFSTTSTLPDVMLPTLSQHSVGHNSRYILKDILQ